MVAQTTRAWAWTTIGALIVVAWGSAWVESALPGFLLVEVGAVFLGIFGTYRAVRSDETLPPEDAERILSWIRGFGPLGVAQLLLFTYFPNSKFGGH